MGATTLRGLTIGGALVALAMASSCGYVPFKSLLSSRHFSLNDIVAMDPQELRLAVKLPRPLQPRPSATSLTLAFEPRSRRGEERREQFPLVLVNEGRTVRAGALPTAEPGYLWYLFKLAPSAEAAFGQLQADISKGKDRFANLYRDVRLEVDLAVRDAAAGQGIELSIWLQPDFSEDFQPIIRQRETSFDSEGRPR